MSYSDSPVVILAGGLATRLGSLTRDTPKALLDVAGKPFIRHQFDLLRTQGLRHVVLCIGAHGDSIRHAVGDGSSDGMSVTYVEDGPVLLGTGGALKNAEAYLTCPFFVIHGDAYLQCDYRRVWETFLESERQALMTVFLNADRWDRSNVRFEGGTILDYDKVRRDPRMQHIDWGLAALQPSALATIPVGEPYDLADLYRYLLSRGQLAGYEVSERFYEIGSVHGLDETRRYLSGTIAGASFPNHTGGSAI